MTRESESEFPVGFPRSQNSGQISGQTEIPVKIPVVYDADLCTPEAYVYVYEPRLDRVRCSNCGDSWNIEHPPESHTIAVSEPITKRVDPSATDISLAVERLLECVDSLSANLAGLYERIDKMEADAKADSETLLSYIMGGTLMLANPNVMHNVYDTQAHARAAIAAGRV